MLKSSLLPASDTGTNDPESSGGKLLDRQDLLLLFHISVRTLQYWRSKGILPYSKIGAKIYYRQKDVEELVSSNRVVHQYSKGKTG